ncbi:MAG: ferrous iron transport protein B [Brevinematia bacterium]
MERFRIALVGAPNSGKTTLFNILTGSRQHVGNWPGVTVEKKFGYFEYKGFQFEVVDLPGIYGLSPNSLEERIARNFIIEEKPDLIINIIDGTTLERSLYLTTELIDSHIKMILAINMFDEVEEKGISIDVKKLETLLKFPVVPLVAKKEKGINELLNRVLEALGENPLERIHIDYGKDIEKAITNMECEFSCYKGITPEYFLRWIIIQILSGDEEIVKLAGLENSSGNIIEKAKSYKAELEKIFNENLVDILNERRLGFINGIVKECVKYNEGLNRVDITDIIDKIVLNKYLSFPFFGIILWVTFQLTFSLGGILSGFIENFISFLSMITSQFLGKGILRDLLVDGIISGVGGVLVFLPQILILFFFIALLEDSGYMARIAFIMDRLMHFLGLHGKSFISLFMGIGCNVPGIMAARTLESEDDRKITVMINPFISCSARLPVYVLITGMFFPKNGGSVIFFLYITGIIVSIFTAKMLKLLFFKKESIPFVMELPPYRLPTTKSLLLHMWERGSVFLKKMGGVILFGSIIIWALGYFPEVKVFPPHIKELESIIGSETDEIKRESLIEKLEVEKKSFRLQNSYIGKIGKFIHPFFKPLGFSWKEGVTLLTGIVGKEVVVSTLSVLYNVKEGGNEELKEKMTSEGISKSVAFAFLVFVLLYVPCLATIAAIFRETSSVKWTLFSLFYGISVAYILSLFFRYAIDIFIKLFA